MRLVVHELVTELSQRIKVGGRDLQLNAVRPHLYKHRSPAGSLFLEVQDTSGRLIKATETIAISAISAATYYHGVIRFSIDLQLRATASYLLVLKSTGYSFAETGYVGWCNDYDLRLAEPDYSPAAGIHAALLWEPWIKKETNTGEAA